MNYLQNWPLTSNFRLESFNRFVELGHIDIATKVSLLASHVALLREGTPQTCTPSFTRIGNISIAHNLLLIPLTHKLTREPSPLQIGPDFYGEVNIAIPDYMPKPL